MVTSPGSIMAQMSASDLALIVVTLLSVLSVLALLVMLQSVWRTLRALRALLTELHEQATPLVAELASAVGEAGVELERVDQLIGSAESISATMDATSRLAYKALSAPMIKTVALASGTSKAAKRLRRVRD